MKWAVTSKREGSGKSPNFRDPRHLARRNTEAPESRCEGRREFLKGKF